MLFGSGGFSPRLFCVHMIKNDRWINSVDVNASVILKNCPTATATVFDLSESQTSFCYHVLWSVQCWNVPDCEQSVSKSGVIRNDRGQQRVCQRGKRQTTIALVALVSWCWRLLLWFSTVYSWGRILTGAIDLPTQAHNMTTALTHVSGRAASPVPLWADA